jgi:hypothetical protein
MLGRASDTAPVPVKSCTTVPVPEILGLGAAALPVPLWVCCPVPEILG